MPDWFNRILRRETSSGPKLRKDKRRRQALAWGFFLTIAGLGLAVLSVFLEAAKNPEPAVSSLGLKSLEHISIAIFLLGTVGVMLEFKSWSQYFEERLADTIMTDRYLRARGQESLGTHLISVFQAYYEKELDYQGSFLEYFRLTLQDQIVAPFREEWRSIITISKGEKGWLVQEDTTFKCRKVGATSTIQDSVAFAVDESDVIDGLKQFSVILTLPDNIDKNFQDPTNFPPRQGNSYKFATNNSLLVPLSGGKLGFSLSLKPVQNIDGLHVHETLEYEMPTGRFVARAMGLLTKGFEVVFNHPDDLEVIVESFGMDKPEPVIVKQKGLYSLNYGSWLLPDSGIAYLFRERPSAAQPPTQPRPSSEKEQAARAMSIPPD